MNSDMKLHEFEALLAAFGYDISAWPEGKRLAADAFIKTEAGRKELAAEAALTKLLTAGRAIGPENASDGNSDAFLDRLNDIPIVNSQHATTNKLGHTHFWIESLAEHISSWRSPMAIASQFGGLAAILVVGIFVGMNSATNRLDAGEDIYGTIDISETLFVSGAELTLDDE